METVDARLAREELLVQRAALYIVSIVVPLFGLVFHITEPDAWDSVLAGFLIGFLAQTAFLISLPNDAPQRTRILSFSVGQILIHWLVVLAVKNDFAVTRVLSVLLAHYCATFVFQRRLTNVAVHVSVAISWTVAILFRPEHAHVGLTLIAVTTTLAVFNTNTMHRRHRTMLELDRREKELHRSRELLEERVSERTADLRREVAVRRAAEEQAYSASRTKSQFLANMSHELRTPLNAVIGYTEMLRESLVKPDSEEDMDFHRILSAARHLLAMINDVLDLAKVESGTLRLTFAPLDIQSLLERVASAIAPTVNAHGNTIEIDVDSAMPCMRTDGKRLFQIVLNLANNAAKFTRNGRIILRAARTLPQGPLEISVIDTGCGIPSRRLESVFSRFVQVDDSSTRTVGGTGLGLTICRDLTHALGGEVTVRSQVGVGSAFTVRLPWPSEAQGAQLASSSA